MDLAGNFRRKIKRTQVKSPATFRGFFISPLFKCLTLLSIIFIFSSCARQIRKPSDKPEKISEPIIKVCIDEKLSNATLAFKGTFIFKTEEAVYYLDETIGTLNVSKKNQKLILENEVRYFEFSSPSILMFRSTDPDFLFTWNKISYSGDLQIVFSSGSSCAVNIVPIETYLRGVVPFEIPTGQDEYREAVFAQAIAARTYAMARMEKSQNKSFDVFADVRDQVYKGQKRTTPLADEAISKTQGNILIVDEKPAYSQYHSTCGGIFETIQDLNSNENSFNEVLNRDISEAGFNCSISPLFRWLEKRSSETILKISPKYLD